MVLSKEWSHFLEESASLRLYLGERGSFKRSWWGPFFWRREMLLFLKSVHAALKCQESIDTLQASDVILIERLEKVAKKALPKERALIDEVTLLRLGALLRIEKVKEETFSLENYNKILTHVPEGERAARFLARLPGHVALFLENEEIFHEWIYWCETLHLDPEIYLYYPALSRRLLKSELAFRISTVRPSALFLSSQKEIYLLMEGKAVPLRNENHRVGFRGGLTLSIEEILKMFERKYCDVGKVEFFYEGVVNWNVFQMGYWDESSKTYHTVDFSHPEWWKELPLIELVDKKEVEKRYNIHLNRGEWGAALHATRKNLNLSYEETHAFLEVAICDPFGRYQIYPFGKYGTHFPANLWEGLKLFTLTMPAGIMYPDENYFYKKRQHAYVGFSLTQERGEHLLSEVRASIASGFKKELVYQVETENCAKWTAETIEKVVEGELPNFYKMSLLDTEPGGAVSRLFSCIRLFPERFHALILTRLHLPIGAFRGMWVKERWASVTHHHFWHTAEVFLPALLVKKKIEGLFEIVEAHLDGWTSLFLLFKKKKEPLFQTPILCYAFCYYASSFKLYSMRPSPPGTG